MRARVRRGAGLAIAAACVVAPAAGWLAPAGLEGPTAVGVGILGVAAALWITEAVPLFVTSFVVLLLAQVWLRPALDGAGSPAPASAFTAPFFSDVILLFLGGLSLSAAMHKHRFDEQMARAVIRATGRSVPLLLAGVMGLSAFLSMFLSNTATTAMMLTLCLPIVALLPDRDASRKALVLSIPFASNIGGIGTPIGTPPNAIAVQYMRQAGEEVSFGQWMLVAVPFVLLSLAIAWGVLLLAHRGYRGMVRLPERSADRIRVTWRRHVVLVVSVLTVCAWLTEPWHGVSTGTVALVPLVLFFALGVLDTTDLHALSWDVLLIMGGGLCLGVVMERAGVPAWFVSTLPLDGLGPWGLTALFAAAACGLSCVMSNTAAANLLMPIVLGLGVATRPELMVAVAAACSVAMPLPISTPPNAIAFSSGEVTVPDMLRSGLTITVVLAALIAGLGHIWIGAMLG